MTDLSQLSFSQLLKLWYEQTVAAKHDNRLLAEIETELDRRVPHTLYARNCRHCDSLITDRHATRCWACKRPL